MWSVELNMHVEADMWKFSLLECPVCLTAITRSTIPCCTNGDTLCSEFWD